MSDKKSTLEQVMLFHKAFKQPILDVPDISDKDVNRLRINLLTEELEELKEALDKGDLVETLDALIDLQYVLDGAFLSFGMHHMKEEAFEEVHRSNMSKLDKKGKPICRKLDGKILKGDNYSRPNIKQFIQKGKNKCANNNKCNKKDVA